MRLVIAQTAHMETGMDDPEFRLMVAACKATYEGSVLVADGLETIDWLRLLALATRHRVEALCWRGLAPAQDEIPPPVAKQFSVHSEKIVEASLRSAAECARLHEKFSSAGVQCLFLKGLALGSLAYPQPFLKMSWDIDLLVDSRQLDSSAQRLKGAGYRLVVPLQANGDALCRWHEAHKESVWYCEAGNFTLDLHVRVADNPFMVPGLGVDSQSQTVTVAPGIDLPTFAKDELFAYLCVHGASSAWFRLKWLTDISALIHRDPPDEIARLYDRSQQLGAGRAADQALLLAEQYFGIALPSSLGSHLHSSPTAEWLARTATKQLKAEVEPTERFLGTASIHYSQPFLQPSWRFKLSEVTGQIRAVLGRA